jgi:hypothetical protein
MYAVRASLFGVKTGLAQPAARAAAAMRSIGFIGCKITTILRTFAGRKKVIVMTETVKIDLSNPMALPFLEYARSLPFVEEGEEKKSFEQAAAECNAVPLDEFFDRLDERIKRRFHA